MWECQQYVSIEIGMYLLKSGNAEIHLHFTDKSDMKEKCLHIFYIKEHLVYVKSSDSIREIWTPDTPGPIYRMCVRDQPAAA